MISGGFAGGGESSSARKAHLHSIRSADMGEIQAVSKLPRIESTLPSRSLTHIWKDASTPMTTRW